MTDTAALPMCSRCQRTIITFDGSRPTICGDCRAAGAAFDPAFTQARWRRGRKVGRTIYAQVGEEPSDDDLLIGVMDTPELAALVVDAVNAY